MLYDALCDIPANIQLIILWLCLVSKIFFCSVCLFVFPVSRVFFFVVVVVVFCFNAALIIIIAISNKRRETFQITHSKIIILNTTDYGLNEFGKGSNH